MYIYPDNLKSKAIMWLWELKDLGIIAVGTLISILALTQTGIMIPLAVTAGYAVLSIRLDDTSIKLTFDDVSSPNLSAILGTSFAASIIPSPKSI